MASLKDKVVVITGASAGVGKALVELVGAQDAHVILACRDEKKTAKAIAEIKAKIGDDARLDFMEIDLASFASVKKFIEEFKSRNLPIHYLFLNAGISTRTSTQDSFSTLVQTNYLGNFYLIHELLPILEVSAPAKIVFTSGGLGQGMNLRTFNRFFDMTRLKEGQTDKSLFANLSTFELLQFYGFSKVMMNSFTRQLAAKIKNKRITIVAVHPGAVSTEIVREFNAFFRWLTPWITLSPINGAKPLLYVATDPKMAEKTGVYFNRFNEEPMTGVAADDDVATRIWNASEEWTGIKYD